MTTKNVEALTEHEYLLMKERLLKKVKEALDAFVVVESTKNSNVEQPDLLYAQMEVFLDIAASAALATEEMSRGDFLDMAVSNFDGMLEIAVEDHLNELEDCSDLGLSPPVSKNKSLN